MKMRRVVITGIGAVTPLGLSFEESWIALKEGSSGISLCSRVKVDDIPWRMAGEIYGFDPLTFLTTREVRRLDISLQYALYSAIGAIKDASLEPGPATAVITGSSRGGISMIEGAFNRRMSEDTGLSPYLMPATTISMASSYIAHRFGLKGFLLGVSNACASGTVAVGEAFRLIRDGYTDMAISGGSEAPLCRICIEGYGRTGALSKGMDSSASRPFDSGRDGFVLAEGACILLLEEMEHALKRGARIYAEIAGYSNVTDASHQTHPSREGEVLAIRQALNDAGIGPEDVDIINAHGTSTQLGDMVEASALREVFGGRLAEVPVTANKSMTGHMLAASGAFEIATTALGIYEGVIPATINIVDPDPQCGLNVITRTEARETENALTSSFGFGGVNSVIVIRRFA
jgi:3-oxoacyl-[acyl-carrier-protein] synthase II